MYKGKKIPGVVVCGLKLLVLLNSSNENNATTKPFRHLLPAKMEDGVCFTTS
jgi:hypothetical protein